MDVSLLTLFTLIYLSHLCINIYRNFQSDKHIVVSVTKRGKYSALNDSCIGEETDDEPSSPHYSIENL